MPAARSPGTNPAPPVLIAIGGGGATHGTHPGLDRFCLRHLPPAPALGYVGTASGDDPGKLAGFRAGFAPHARSIAVLPPSADAGAARAWVDGLDMVYVGGGDPDRLVAHWRDRGIDRVLMAAARAGVVLAGVSAGAMCWFERYLRRDAAGRLVTGAGLGLFPGAVTPHSLDEPDRRASLAGHVADGRLPDAWAIDDGAALVIAGDGPACVFPAEGPPHVYRIARRAGGTTAETVLSA